MHEWLSGGASPCQGEGRGFESRLVLFLFLLKVEKEKVKGGEEIRIHRNWFPLFLIPERYKKAVIPGKS